MASVELFDASPIPALLERLSSLEAIVNGPITHGSNFLQLEIKDLDNQLTTIEDVIPDLNPCRDLLDKVTPIVTMHRSRINAIVEKAAEILSNEKIILHTISEIQQVQRFAVHLSTEGFDGMFKNGSYILLFSSFFYFVDLTVEQAKVAEIKSILFSLQNECHRQTQELDQLMEFYEKSMVLLASVSCAWDARLVAFGV